ERRDGPERDDGSRTHAGTSLPCHVRDAGAAARVYLENMREPRVGDGRPRRRRIAAALWLIAAALGWVLLAGVARAPSPGAARLTSVLFVVALPLTYCAILGAAVRASARPRRAVLPAAAVTLGFVLSLGLLELSAATGLVHWDHVPVSPRRDPELYVR